MNDFTLADQHCIGLMIFKNFGDQDWIWFNFIGSGLDLDWKFSQSAHLCYTQAWVSEGGQEFKNFSKKGCFLSSSGKKKISPLWLHKKNFWKNPLMAPWKKSFRRLCTSMLNYTTFV